MRVLQLKNSHGMSFLLPTLVTAMVTSALALLISRNLGFGLRGQSHLELKSDVTSVRRLLIEAVDCKASFATCGMTPCVCPSTTVPLKQKNNAILVASGGSLLSELAVKAYCEVGRGIVPRFAKIKKGKPLNTVIASDFVRDALNSGIAYDWNYEHNEILGENVYLCGEYFQVSGTSPVAPPTCPAGSTLASGAFCTNGNFQTGFITSLDKACCRSLVNGIDRSLLFWDLVNNQINDIPTSKFDPVSQFIGIGTTTPTAKVEIQSTISAPLLRVDGPKVRPFEVNQDGFLFVRKGLNNLVPYATGPFAFNVNTEAAEWNMALIQNQSGGANVESRLAVVGSKQNTAETTNVAAFDLANNSDANRAWWHVTLRGNGDLRFQYQPTKLNLGGGVDKSHIRFTTDGRILVSADGGPLSQVNTTKISDMRLKTDITPLRSQELLRKLLRLSGYSFRLKHLVASNPDNYDYGVMAQEVEREFPRLVKHNREAGYLYVNYEGFAAIFIEAFKAIHDELDRNRRELDELRSKVGDLESRISRLEH